MESRNNFDPKELLKPDNMLRLYASGAFPMADEKGETINWYMPEIRTIIPLDAFNFPRSYRKAIEKMNFEIKFDTDFTRVVMGCSDREDTWISQELINAYKRLRKRGHVHTVETWFEGNMVGGLYGVTFRGAFFGESMFSVKPNGSKIALATLAAQLIDWNFDFIDCQVYTEHLSNLGAKPVARRIYLEKLKQSMQSETKAERWQNTIHQKDIPDILYPECL